MIDWRDPDGRPDRKITTLSALRWTVAISLVVAAHGGAAWLALHWRPAAANPGSPPAAVMIELAPIAVAPEPVPTEVAPSPQVTEAQPDPVPDPPEKQPEDQPEMPEPVVEDPPKPIEEPTPVPVPQPQVEVPKLPEVPKADAVLTPPPKAQMQERKKQPPKRAASPQTSAPNVQAQRANRLAAPSSSTAPAPAAAVATWRSALMAHLNRYKRFPAGATGTGVTTVVFTIDRSGRVVGARLARSSGDSVLDSEAVALARRASPVPAPPAGQGGSTLTISVPIRFDRR